MTGGRVLTVADWLEIWPATRAHERDKTLRGYSAHVRALADGDVCRLPADAAGNVNASPVPTDACLRTHVPAVYPGCTRVYPQQWFPRFVIQAAAEPLPGTSPEIRARNQLTIDGPIPRMLDRAMEWARRTFDTAIVTAPDGSVHDRYAYPLVAFRELIANALIHRDLDGWSAGLAIEVRLRRDRLVIGNPGGLYGITVDRLGRDPVTSARNARLVAICQHVYSAETGARAIETLASGIPIITDALAGARLPPAHYIDSGIRFTVILSQPASQPAVTPATRDQAIYRVLGDLTGVSLHAGLSGSISSPTALC